MRKVDRYILRQLLAAFGFFVLIFTGVVWLTQAVRLIDTGLSDLMHRELVSTDEISDLLLDVRMLLTAAELAAGSEPLVEETVGA